MLSFVLCTQFPIRKILHALLTNHICSRLTPFTTNHNPHNFSPNFLWIFIGLETTVSETVLAPRGCSEIVTSVLQRRSGGTVIHENKMIVGRIVFCFWRGFDVVLAWFCVWFWRGFVFGFGVVYVLVSTWFLTWFWRGFWLCFGVVSGFVLAWFLTWFWRGFLLGFGMVSVLVLEWFLTRF